MHQGLDALPVFNNLPPAPVRREIPINVQENGTISRAVTVNQNEANPDGNIIVDNGVGNQAEEEQED